MLWRNQRPLVVEYNDVLKSCFLFVHRFAEESTRRTLCEESVLGTSCRVSPVFVNGENLVMELVTG